MCINGTSGFSQTDVSIIYGIDTNYHSINDQEIVRHQIILKTNQLLPLLQVDQNKEDFEFVGTKNYGDSIIFIFNNYNSPIGISRYYLILPILSKVYYASFYEYESAFLDSIDLATMFIYYIDFKSECGVLNKKEISIAEIGSFPVNESFFQIIMAYPLK